MNTIINFNLLASITPESLISAFSILNVLGLAFVLLMFIVPTIGFCQMFHKAGIAAWKAFIPFLSDFICFKLCWNTKLFIPYLIAVTLATIPAENNIALLLLALIGIIASLVFVIKLNIKLAKSFGKSAGWGILLLLFPFITSYILGFGSAKYVGIEG